MDYNKLIKGIIKAAKEDPAINIGDPKSADDNTRLITTLRLEVRVSRSQSETIDEDAINTMKLVMLRIND